MNIMGESRESLTKWDEESERIFLSRIKKSMSEGNFEAALSLIEQGLKDSDSKSSGNQLASELRYLEAVSLRYLNKNHDAVSVLVELSSSNLTNAW